MTQQLQSTSPTPVQAWVCLDWLSVAFPQPALDPDIFTHLPAVQKALIHPAVPEWLSAFVARGNWTPREGRKGQKISLMETASAARLYYGGPDSVAVAELSGSGCSALRQLGIGDRTAAAEASESCTRIDVAIDFLHPVEVTAVKEWGWSKRFRSYTEEVSQSGDTLYIGSKTAERFCRVYRYKPPHPRADFLRVEIVSRRKHAKTVCQAIRGVGLGAVAANLLHGIGLKTPLFQSFQASNVPLTPIENKRTSSKRLRWLLTQVTPALRDMHRAGEVDIKEWFAREFEGC